MGERKNRVLRFAVSGALLVAPMGGCGDEEPTPNVPAEETINVPPEPVPNPTAPDPVTMEAPTPNPTPPEAEGTEGAPTDPHAE